MRKLISERRHFLQHPAVPETVFLTAKKPLVFRVAEWLASQVAENPLDLSRWAVVLPTAGAARRLRGELLGLAQARGTGLLPPFFCGPMELLAAAAGREAAGKTERLLAWTKAVAASPQRFPILLGGFADLAHPGTALRIARSLMEVCSLLAEAGLTPSSPEVRAACPFEEDRWRELGALYRKYLKILEDAGLAEANELCLRAAAEGKLPSGVERVVVAGVPDLNLLAQRYLEKLEKVSILVDAAGCGEARFDAWGRPDVESWTRALLPLREEDIWVAADPVSEAELAAHMLGGAGLCLADSAAVPYHQAALRNRGLVPFDPAGKRLAEFPCASLAAAWISFCRSREMADLRVLAEHPVFLEALARAAKLAPDEVLAAVDTVRTGLLLDALPDVLAHDPVPPLATAVESLRKKFEAGRSLAKLPDFLQAMYASAVVGEGEAAALEALSGLLGEFLKSPLSGSESALELFCSRLEDLAIYEAHGEEDIELHGWLEAGWLPQASLVLSGCSEGALPANVSGHAFLPDSLRQALGLQSNRQRLARDLCLLHGLLAARPAGQVRLTLSRTGAEGDPVRPSRLLFRCADEDLPARVRKLFGPAPALPTAPVRQRAWTLEVPQKPPPASLRVTAFGDYLDCPLRFYFRHVLKMEGFDPQKAEMDARDFGIVLHAVVEAFAKDPGVRDSREAAAIEKFVLAELDAVLASRHGRRLSLPVRVQRESLRARLRQFARLQAEERRAGWRIAGAEVPFTAEDTLALAGLPVTARFDRIDLHEQTGRRRILDYKTYRALKGNTPPETHFGPADTGFPEAEFVFDGKPRRWRQLQLPLYRALAAFRWPEAEPPLVGYFLLPEKLEESAILELELDEPLFASALRCATAVAERVRHGVFWPPREVRYDDFAEMFPMGDPENAVSEHSLAFLKGGAR